MTLPLPLGRAATVPPTGPLGPSSAPPLLPPPAPVSISVESSNKSELHITSGKEGVPGASNSLPKMPVFKFAEESCLSLKFKWIALGHKRSGGVGWGGAHLHTQLPHPTGELRDKERN